MNSVTDSYELGPPPQRGRAYWDLPKCVQRRCLWVSVSRVNVYVWSMSKSTGYKKARVVKISINFTSQTLPNKNHAFLTMPFNIYILKPSFIINFLETLFSKYSLFAFLCFHSIISITVRETKCFCLEYFCHLLGGSLHWITLSLILSLLLWNVVGQI